MRLQDFVQGSSDAAKFIFMQDNSRDMTVFIVILYEGLSVCVPLFTASGILLIIYCSFFPLQAVPKRCL